MSDPTRLLSEGASEFEQELLGSWHDEQPSDRARRRALALAGAGAAVTVTASTTATAAVAPKATLAVVTAKWLGMGVLAGLATSAVALEVAPGAPVTTRETTSERAPTPPVRAPGPVAAPMPLKLAEPAPSAASPGTPRPVPAPTLHGTLGPETAALDQARGALKAGDPAKTLGLVARYQREFPGGVLAQEAAVLRIDALAQQGNRRAAAAEARRFLNAHPHSPHAERLQILAGASTNP
jgi:hypothetical protein